MTLVIIQLTFRGANYITVMKLSCGRGGRLRSSRDYDLLRELRLCSVRTA